MLWYQRIQLAVCYNYWPVQLVLVCSVLASTASANV